MKKNHWIFISPHFDDVALSCGGLVWDLSNKGHTVEIWTIMGGFPPEDGLSDFARQTHHAWGVSAERAIEIRRQEDLAACRILGAQPRHFDWQDAIYRRDPKTNEPLVNNNQELFGKPPEEHLLSELCSVVKSAIREGTCLVLPLGLGSHIDHRAVTSMGDQLDRVDFYYADYPYILKNFDLPALHSGTWEKRFRFLDQDALNAWQEAVLCYESQLAGFWRDSEESRLALRNYAAGGGGRLWQKAGGDRTKLGWY